MLAFANILYALSFGFFAMTMLALSEEKTKGYTADQLFTFSLLTLIAASILFVGEKILKAIEHQRNLLPLASPIESDLDPVNPSNSEAESTEIEEITPTEDTTSSTRALIVAVGFLLVIVVVIIMVVSGK